MKQTKASTQRDYKSLNDQAAAAAQWMCDELQKQGGELTQDQAWKGVRKRFGADCAQNSETDCWLSRQVLTAFRKLTPDVIWDPAGKQWRASRRSDDLDEGSRILNVASEA